MKVKPFKGILYTESQPTYGQSVSGDIIGWNNTMIPIVTSSVLGIEPVTEGICLVETRNSIYLIKMQDTAYDRDFLYQMMDVADLD